MFRLLKIAWLLNRIQISVPPFRFIIHKNFAVVSGEQSENTKQVMMPALMFFRQIHFIGHVSSLEFKIVQIEQYQIVEYELLYYDCSVLTSDYFTLYLF